MPRPLIADLSLLPVPDDVGANRGYASLNIAASRGCYGECSFCFIHRYYGCSRRRTRDLASLERELEIRLSRRDIESLYFIDPTFIGLGEGERERVLEIGRMAQRFGLPFGFETRVDGIDEELLANLADTRRDLRLSRHRVRLRYRCCSGSANGSARSRSAAGCGSSGRAGWS